MKRSGICAVTPFAELDAGSRVVALMPRRSLVKQEPIAELQGACPGLKHWYWHVDVKVAAIRQHCMQRTQLALATRARYNSLRHPNRMFHAAQARSPLYTNTLPSRGQSQSYPATALQP